MNKKRGKSLKININLSNRWLYTLILIGILAAVGVGIYAATYSPSGGGHPYTEISTCGANQTLKMNSDGSTWTCASDEGISQAYADANYKDPPGQWTCTLRTATGSPSTASCVGSEKIIAGGCSSSNTGVGDLGENHPISNGWTCKCQSFGCGQITTYAYCCL